MKIKKALCATLAASLMLPVVAVPGQAEAAQGKWKHGQKGWWYAYSNGDYAKDGWLKDKGKWYFMNEEGYMVTGWQKDAGKWFYLGGNGAMVTGWKMIDGEWYYFAGSGAMAKGWKKIKNKWYLFEGSGAMITGWYEKNGVQYYFKDSGEMATGTVEIEGSIFEFGEDGAYMPEEGPIDGGWSKPLAEMVDEEKQAIFDKATEEWTGSKLEAMAYLGYQIVAGKNHAFLCKETLVLEKEVQHYAIVIIYEDLQGQASIKDILCCDEIEITEEGLAGGYTAPVSILLSSNDIVIDEAQKAFYAAMVEFVGANYDPLAVLGTQVVAGTNYRIFCFGKGTDAESQAFFAIVTVYKDLGGNCTVQDVSSFAKNEG